MIDVLLKPYEDELFYSWLARSYVKNCYPDYKMFSLQVMGRRDTNPSFEFINKIEEAEQRNMHRYNTDMNITNEQQRCTLMGILILPYQAIIYTLKYRQEHIQKCFRKN